MDGQGDAIRTFDEFEDYTIEAMTIDYENDHLYFRVDGGQPYALSRCNSDFSNLRRAILDFRPNNFVYGHPLPPFAVHNGLIYIIIEDRGLLTFYTGGSTGIRCFNSLLSTPVYSTEVIHHGRQPGECLMYLLQHVLHRCLHVVDSVYNALCRISLVSS